MGQTLKGAFTPPTLLSPPKIHLLVHMATGLVPVVPLGVKNPNDDLKNVGVGSVTPVVLSVNSRTSGSLSGRLYGRSDPAKNEGFAICKQRKTPTVSEGADIVLV